MTRVATEQHHRRHDHEQYGNEPEQQPLLLHRFSPTSDVPRTTDPNINRHARTDRVLSHPGWLTIGYFLSLIVLVTLLLLIPAASREQGSTNFPIAAFTAVSALSTCGIPVVNMTEHWTLFGQAIILVSVQLGGLGVMTFASIITVGISKRLSASQRILTAVELGTTKLSEVKSILNIVLASTFIIESITFVALFPRLLAVNQGNVRHSAWEALFFAVSSYNNTGFTPDSAGVYINDWGVGLPIMLSAFIGTIGFPVLLNIYATCRRHRGPRFWNLHTKMTLTSMAVVIALSMLWFLVVEWNNTQIYHQSDIASKIRDALTASMMPRTTGFDTSWMPYVSEPTKGFLSMVMFIGGGSASTAGGIRVTTLAVLFLICRSVFDGRAQAMAFHRRIPSTTVRIAITIAISSLAVVYLATLSLAVVTERSLSDCLFEVCSAFSLGGSTLGVGSPDNRWSLLILAVVMLVGRIGPMTIAYAVARPKPPDAVKWPEENIVVG